MSDIEDLRAAHEATGQALQRIGPGAPVDRWMEARDAHRAATHALVSHPDFVPPAPTGKRAVNSHLVNDHMYTDGGAGNSGRNMPSVADLRAQHQWLHEQGAADHEHYTPRTDRDRNRR